MYRCMFWYSDIGPWKRFVPYERADHELQHTFEDTESAIEAIRVYMEDSPESYHPVGIFLEIDGGTASIPLIIVTARRRVSPEWFRMSKVVQWKDIVPLPSLVVVV